MEMSITFYFFDRLLGLYNSSSTLYVDIKLVE